MIIKPKINNLLKNYNDADFDQYEQLFESFIYICKTFYKKGTIISNIKDEDIKTNYDSSKNLLLNAAILICDGRNPHIIKMIIEIECSKLIDQNGSIVELEELILAKNLIFFLLDQNFDAIYETIIFLCSDSIYTKLLPTVNWIST